MQNAYFFDLQNKNIVFALHFMAILIARIGGRHTPPAPVRACPRPDGRP